MNNIIVSGLINLETTLKVDHFPIEYYPVRYPFFGIRSSIAGVGYNIAKALKTLGQDPILLSLVGRDQVGELVIKNLGEQQLGSDMVLKIQKETAQSVIVYDDQGRRQIHTDLKDIQNLVYPVEIFRQIVKESSLAVLCNINFSRPLLAEARQAGAMIATDVHAISNLDDEYNHDFMSQADILFMSHENLPVSPEEWTREIFNKFRPEIVVIGLGSDGALLGVLRDRYLKRFPAVRTRKIINTIGAGDALFSCFLKDYLATKNPYTSIEKAIIFASYKIGDAGAADGFLDADALDQLASKLAM